MKFWTFYGERWAAKTQHLTMMQEGAYRRLCDWCMLHERPLPPNRKDVLRVARARGYSQEKATMAVLDEFFSLQADGYHQKTLDEILDWWHSSGALQQSKNDASSRARITALRERRAVMVEALRVKGVKVPYSMGITAVRELCAEHHVTVPPEALHVTRNGKNNVNRNALSINPVSSNVTRCARNGVSAPPPDGPEGPSETETEDDADRPGPLSRALKAMEKAGLEGVHPNHPLLTQLLDAGVTPQAFHLAAKEAVIRCRGYAWMLAMMKGRIEDAARNGNGAPRPQNGRTSGFLDDADPLVSPEALERLRKRFLDPSVDPWDLPAHSPSEGDDANEINNLGAGRAAEL